MQWPDLVSQLSFYCQQEQPDPSFTAATPSFVNNTELEIYRDLSFLATSGQNTSLQTVAMTNLVDLSQMTGQTVNGTTVAYGYPVVVQGIAAQVGNRWIQYQLATQDWCDVIWPDLTQTAPPALGLAYYNMLDELTAKLVPVPDLVYPLRISGKFRPAPMSAANPVTWLGTNLPDLLFAGVVREALRYQRDFGAGSPDPQALPAWQSRFEDLKRGAQMEEMLKAGQGPEFSTAPPTPMARPAPPPPGAGA